MLTFIKNWIEIHEDEISLFLWSLLLLFLIRSSGIIFNNYTETAFLKRFGVEYLPIVYMLNSIITFVIMALLAGTLSRSESSQILAHALLFCSISASLLRLVIPYNFSLLYPLLFILKAQYEILLGLLFWNLANDLFNVRQSKRLFPMIVAGGVMGEILGSFMTPLLGKAISLDNLMLAYAVNTMLAFIAVTSMRRRFPTLLLAMEPDRKPTQKPSVIEQVRSIQELIKETPLVPILVFLALLPNILIPILNYQFNYAVNTQFASETGMIQFFGYFRGAMNMVSLFLLLFVGKVYVRIGLPTALMFHPFNYILVFMAFLFRFDILSAMYARLSTNVIRTTFNKPVTDVLMGIFPTSYRSRIRPFLRGTVVRIGLFAGSGLILLSDGWFHPRYLSVVVLPLVVIWILVTVYLKKNYSKILAGLLSKDMLDFKSMEDRHMNHLFKDTQTQGLLMQAFASAKGDEAVWYANLLHTLSVKDLDMLLIQKIKDLQPPDQIKLLDMVSSDSVETVVHALEEMADPNNQKLFVAIIKTLKRIQADTCTLITENLMDSSRYPEVRAYAATCLFGGGDQKLRTLVTAWLRSEDHKEKKAGVVAAGESRDSFHIPLLEDLLVSHPDPNLIPLILHALKQLSARRIQDHAVRYLTHSHPNIRKAALDVIEILDDQALSCVIPLLADHSRSVQETTKLKIQNAPYQNGKLLIESLNKPQKRLRDELFNLLKSLEIKEHDTFLFALSQIENSYVNLSIIDALGTYPKTDGKLLLREHLEQKTAENVESLFRVLSIRDTTGRFRVVFRSLFSKDTRQKANAFELMEGILDPALFRLLIPLLDSTDISRALEIGRKKFNLPVLGENIHELYLFLLDWKCWVSIVHTMSCIIEDGLAEQYQVRFSQLSRDDNPIVRREARYTLERTKNPSIHEAPMTTEISIPDKIVYLKKIDIFKKLSVNELAAIASITQKEEYQPREIIFQEQDPAETMYLIIDGELSTLKNGKEVVRKFMAGQNIGEAALLLDEPRLLTLRAEVRTQVLVIHKQEFIEIVREYPQIGLEISRVLAGHIQRLLDQLAEKAC